MVQSKKTMMCYQEKFGVPGELLHDDVNTRLAEMDAFLDGYFIALAADRHESPLAPVMEAMQIIVEYDTKIDYTRIDMAIKIIFEPVPKSRVKKTYGDLTNALTAFMGSRFPNAEGKQ